MSTSVGLVLHRTAPNRPDTVEVLVGHLGGPFWTAKHERAWTFPKGLPEDGEWLLATADREFAEEIGRTPPVGPSVDLGPVRRNGKTIRLFARAGDVDVEQIESNLFEMEWPPRSGRRRAFPELDRAEWVPLDRVGPLLSAGQRPFVDRLRAVLRAGRAPTVPEGDQAPIAAVAFDKDGTLLDVEATWGPLMATVIPAFAGDRAAAVAAALGVDLDTAALDPGSPVIAESNAQLAARVASALDRDAADVLPELEALVDRAAAEHAVPFPGVTDVLDDLAARGVPVGLVTNDGVVSATAQLGRLGWLDSFAEVIGYDSGAGTKPEPGPLLEWARRAGVAPSEVLFVGDTDTDAGAAVAAGCSFLRVGDGDGLGEVSAWLDAERRSGVEAHAEPVEGP